MGNTTSYENEKDGKSDTLLLNSVVEEVRQVSSALRNTVEGIRHQQKQQTEDTTNAAKEMLDDMLKDVFGKLRDYFKTNASATCTESHEKGPDPTDSVDIIKKTQNDLLTKADLSEAEIKELIGTMTKLKERHISVDNFLAHFEEYGKPSIESNPSQPLSRGNSKKSSSFQPKQFSKEGKNHDRTERHANTIGAGNTAGTGDGAGNFEAGNCSVKERTGNRIVASVPGISEVRNKANPTIRDITENRSLKGQTVNAYATSLTTNRTSAGKTNNLKLTGKARSYTFSDGNGKNTLNKLRGGQLENRSIKYEDDKLNASYEFGDGADTDETSDGHLEVIKGNENESLQTNDKTTNDDSTEIERLMKNERLLKDEILCLELTCTDHQNKLKLVTDEKERLANDVTTKEQDIKSKLKEIMSLKQDNEKLVLRLSKLAGEKLTKDNPNITDLSDPNRPTKLGEIYSELYDNEWTDAYEGLTNEGYEETEAIKILNITLKNAYRFCAQNAADMLKKTEHVAVKLFEECNKSQISVCQSVAIPMSRLNDGTRQFSHSVLEEQFIERHWKPKIVPVRDHTGGRRAPKREQEVIKPAKMEGELVKLRKEVSLSMVPVVQQTTCQEWSDKRTPPLGRSNNTEEGSHILAKAGLSDTITKRLLETLKEVTSQPVVDIEHLQEQVEKYSKSHTKGISSPTSLSRENSDPNSDDQQKLRFEIEKHHDGKKNHQVRRDRDTTTETDNTRKRLVRDNYGNYLETDETKNRTVGNRKDLKHADVGDIKTTPTKKEKTSEIERLQDYVRKLEIDIDAWEKENTELKMELKRTDEKKSSEVVQLHTHIKTKQNQIQSLKEENESLVLRLSKLAGEKLTKDNPNITDLSDPNRPTKLGEIYSELYDNQWTDAFEGLTQAGYQEAEAIRALNITLKHAYKFCAEKASEMLTKTEDVAMQIFEACTESQISVWQSMELPRSTDNGSEQYSHSMRDEQFIERHWKPKQLPVGDRTGERRAPNRDKLQAIAKPAKMESELVKLRKEVSLSMVPIVQKAYLWGKWDEACIEPLKPYIQKCLFLCWMMVVQSPPMVFDKNTEEDTRFESALYKQYTQSGEVLEYVVWPALFLHENGSLVCKGVAQPKKAKE